MLPSQVDCDYSEHAVVYSRHMGRPTYTCRPPTHMQYFIDHARIICRTPSLRYYGAALALANGVAAWFWFSSQPLDLIVGRDSIPVCWPFFEACQEVRIFSASEVRLAVVGLLSLSVFSALLFSSAPSAKWGLLLLAAITAIRLGILLQDYRLLLNQHYMLTWVTLVFLAVRPLSWTLPRLLVSFYVAAGTLKLNIDWISGASLFGRVPLFVPPDLVPLACAYVVALELVVVWGLLSQRGWIFYASFAQFALFHISSYSVVGFFYPALMLLLLSILPLLRRRESAPAPRPLPQTPRPILGVAVLLLFCLAQLAPRVMPGDTALTGEARTFALNMFDAPVECRNVVVIKYSEGAKQIGLSAPLVQRRLSCDPIVYLSLGRNICRGRQRGSGVIDFDLTLDSRRVGRTDWLSIVSVKDFCAQHLNYSFVSSNNWINHE